MAKSGDPGAPQHRPVLHALRDARRARGDLVRSPHGRISSLQRPGKRWVGELPYVMSASVGGGGHGKAVVVRGVG